MEIDTAGDPVIAAEMVTKTGGTWITPTIVIGNEVGLGFDPEWIKGWVHE